MASTVRVTSSVAVGSTSHSATISHTVENLQIFEETVPDASTNVQFLLAIDISAAKVVSLLADQNLTVKTNSSGSPQETITLVAGRPKVWNTGDTAMFAGDVNSIFVTNASGSDTVLKIIVGTDLP
jgi:hypothetical protein